ncbi:transmembrane reductase CYB561D2-like [Ptychodera flava]|uniref:transmembrane reductase CYB561D2-like n=1 Tax=Ptychodera flava TaxID=63121 RepID=UPI00396A460B
MIFTACMADDNNTDKPSLVKNSSSSIGFCGFLGMVAHLVSIVFCGIIIYHAWPGSSLFSWHPTLMCVSFAFLMAEAILFFSPESTLLPKAMRKTKVKYHWINMVTAIACAVAGLVIIFINKNIHGKSHFTSWHGILGLITVIYSCLQSTGGTLLLYPKVVSGMVKLADLKLYHATSGLLLFTLACTTLILGLYSNWFVSQVSDTVWYISFLCPGLIGLVVMNQVTTAYLPKAFKKPSQQI